MAVEQVYMTNHTKIHKLSELGSDTYVAPTFQEDMETESLQQQQAIQSIISTLEMDTNQTLEAMETNRNQQDQQQTKEEDTNLPFTLVKKKSKAKNKGK
jgi:hypothetical protein